MHLTHLKGRRADQNVRPLIDPNQSSTDKQARSGESKTKKDNKHLHDWWFNKKLDETFKRRITLGLARESEDGQSTRSETAIVQEDDVCIHVIGLPAKLTPEVAFAGVYGVVEQPQTWRIPNTNFELFVADSKLYHRDQLIPVKGPLVDLGVNFHGELRLTADRTEVIQNHISFWQYQSQLQEALDVAISYFPDLAVLVLDSYLRAQDNRYRPWPAGTTNADQYRTAFQTVCRTSRPDLFEDGQRVFPYSCRRSREDVPILREMDFVPWPLHDRQLDVLEAAGAYTSPVKFSETMFLGSPKMPSNELVGANMFQTLVRQIRSQTSSEVSIVKYPYSKPRCVVRDGQVFLACPKPCNKCLTQHCQCWIGPALIRVAEALVGEEDLDLEKIFEIYDESRGGRKTETSKTSVATNPEIKIEEDEEHFISDRTGASCDETLTDISDTPTEESEGNGTPMDVEGFSDEVSACLRCNLF